MSVVVVCNLEEAGVTVTAATAAAFLFTILSPKSVLLVSLLEPPPPSTLNWHSIETVIAILNPQILGFLKR